MICKSRNLPRSNFYVCLIIQLLRTCCLFFGCRLLRYYLKKVSRRECSCLTIQSTHHTRWILSLPTNINSYDFVTLNSCSHHLISSLVITLLNRLFKGLREEEPRQLSSDLCTHFLCMSPIHKRHTVGNKRTQKLLRQLNLFSSMPWQAFSQCLAHRYSPVEFCIKYHLHCYLMLDNGCSYKLVSKQSPSPLCARLHLVDVVRLVKDTIIIAVRVVAVLANTIVRIVTVYQTTQKTTKAHIQQQTARANIHSQQTIMQAYFHGRCKVRNSKHSHALKIDCISYDCHLLFLMVQVTSLHHLRGRSGGAWPRAARIGMARAAR